MARGNQRDLARAKNLKKQQAENKNNGHSAPKKGGTNADGDALAAKIAKKAAMQAEGKLPDGGNKGTKYVAKAKVVNHVNPHTGKKDAKFNSHQK